MGAGVIYARYSSHNQRDVSIDQQIDAGMRRASDEGIPIVRVYSDRAISGKTDKRPDFQRMMRDAEKNEFSFVVAWKSNRIGRNMLESMLNEAKLNSLGIRVIYVEESFDDSAAGRFAARSMMNVNQFYSESMAEDVMRGMNDNAEKCMVNGAVGYGHKKGSDGRYAVDEAEASFLLEIYRRVANLESIASIYEDFNARMIPSPSGGKWNRSSFHRLLPPNERVIGVYQWGDTRVVDGVPRLIPDDLYYRVSEVLKVKKTTKRRSEYCTYMLTGKLYCGYCEAPMTGVSGTGKSGDVHNYYVCAEKRKTHKCKKKNVRKDSIETAVAQAIKDYVLVPDVVEWIADSSVAYAKKLEEGEALMLLQDSLSTVQKSINNIMNAIEQGIFTDTTKDRLLALEKEQAELQAKINVEKANIIKVDKKDIVAGLMMFRDGDIHDPKFLAQLFDTFLHSVYLYDDELKLVFTFSGDNKTKRIPFNISDAPPSSALRCSFLCSSSLPTAPPLESKSNTELYMFGSFFVLSCSLD